MRIQPGGIPDRGAQRVELFLGFRNRLPVINQTEPSDHPQIIRAYRQNRDRQRALCQDLAGQHAIHARYTFEPGQSVRSRKPRQEIETYSPREVLDRVQGPLDSPRVLTLSVGQHRLDLLDAQTRGIRPTCTGLPQGDGRQPRRRFSEMLGQKAGNQNRYRMPTGLDLVSRRFSFPPSIACQSRLREPSINIQKGLSGLKQPETGLGVPHTTHDGTLAEHFSLTTDQI